MATALKRAFDARGLKMKHLSGKPGICYSVARKQYVGERGVGPRYAILYEKLFGIPRSELRPDYWPPEEQAGKKTDTEQGASDGV